MQKDIKLSVFNVLDVDKPLVDSLQKRPESLKNQREGK